MQNKSLKHILLFACIHVALQNNIAQNVGIGTSTPNASARLEVSSTTQGILIPTMTSTQRSAISAPANGLLVYQTDGTPGFYYFNGSAWINLSNGYQPNSLGHAVSPSYGFTTTIAGTGSPGYTDATGTAAAFSTPYGITTDPGGNIYVADNGNRRIRKITPAGVVTTFAGSSTPGSIDGTGTGASFVSPLGMTTDANGNIYVSNTLTIRKITPGGVVTTLAGSTSGFSDGTGTAARFNGAKGMAADAVGNVYVADANNQRIRKITPSGVVTTFAGSGISGSINGTGTAARFNTPFGLAIDAMGNIYVADQNNHKIRKIAPDGVVSNFAGSGVPGADDGTGILATFFSPSDLAIDGAGNLYVADYTNNKIRKITPAGVVTTLAGTGVDATTDGASTIAAFHTPWFIAVDIFGNIYVSDDSTHTIRKIIAR